MDLQEIALEHRPTGHLAVPIVLEGRPTLAIVDLGSSMTLVTTDFSQSLGWSEGVAAGGTGLVGSVAVEIHPGVSFVLGSQSFSLEQVAVIDLGEAGDGLGADIGVILGADWLLQVDLEFPPALDRVTVRGAGESTFAGTSIPLRQTVHGWEGTVWVNGKRFSGLLDTGSVDSLIGPKPQKKLGFRWDELPHGDSAGLGADGVYVDERPLPPVRTEYGPRSCWNDRVWTASLHPTSGRKGNLHLGLNTLFPAGGMFSLSRSLWMVPDHPCAD